ncbi:unnamed protein product, partial [Discosporangium mesarthrocarpum]
MDLVEASCEEARGGGINNVCVATYCWGVDSIGVRDLATSSTEEEVGQGLFAATYDSQSEGDFSNPLALVVTASNTGHRMEIPTEALNSISWEEWTATSSSQQPTLILHLSIGCLVVLHGLSQQLPMGNSEGAGEGRVVIPSPSMSRGSESTITGTGKEVEDMGSGEATCGKGKTFFDDVFCDTRLVELVSTLSSKVEDKPEGGSSQCPSGVGRVKKVGQGELQDAEGANASILNASPDAPTAKPNPKCKSATGMEFGKGAGQRAGGSNEEGTLSWGEKRKEDAGVSKRAITKVGKGVYAGSWSSFDEDIPDDQWRRPMVTYGQRGPRSVSRRRRSMGRSVAQDIAIISPAMKKLRQGSAPGHSLG